MWAKKNECGQENLSVLSVSVSVECGLWTVDYDSAVSGEPPSHSPKFEIDGKISILYGEIIGRNR